MLDLRRMWDCNSANRLERWVANAEKEEFAMSRIYAQNPNVRVVAVEPASSPVLSRGVAGAHKIQNIVVFLPDTGDRYLSTPLFAE